MLALLVSTDPHRVWVLLKDRLCDASRELGSSLCSIINHGFGQSTWLAWASLVFLQNERYYWNLQYKWVKWARRKKNNSISEDKQHLACGLSVGEHDRDSGKLKRERPLSWKSGFLRKIPHIWNVDQKTYYIRPTTHSLARICLQATSLQLVACGIKGAIKIIWLCNCPWCPNSAKREEKVTVQKGCVCKCECHLWNVD